MIIFIDSNGARFTEPEIYTFFARLWTQAQVVFGFQGDPSYNFQTQDMRVNLMGIRGLFYAFEDNRPTYQNGVAMNKSGVFDDCIMILRKEGDKATIRAYSASLEYGKPAHGDEAKLRDLRLGMHRYHFGVHHQGSPKVRLDKSWFFPKGKGYRALRPFDAGAFYDDNRDRTQNPGEKLCRTNHWGFSA